MAAFEHTGAAKRLIHNLKYRGVGGYPDLVASTVGPHLPRLPLVPVPRAWTRRFRYGIDPSLVLAGALAARIDAPVLRLLQPAFHTPRRAGGDHTRPVPRFQARRPDGFPVLLVDDVVTTGGTVLAAVESLGASNVHLVVAANVVSGPSTLRRP